MRLLAFSHLALGAGRPALFNATFHLSYMWLLAGEFTLRRGARCAVTFPWGLFVVLPFYYWVSPGAGVMIVVANTVVVAVAARRSLAGGGGRRR